MFLLWQKIYITVIVQNGKIRTLGSLDFSQFSVNQNQVQKLDAKLGCFAFLEALNFLD